MQPYYRSNPNGLRYDNHSYTRSQPLIIIVTVDIILINGIPHLTILNRIIIPNTLIIITAGNHIPFTLDITTR